MAAAGHPTDKNSLLVEQTAGCHIACARFLVHAPSRFKARRLSAPWRSTPPCYADPLWPSVYDTLANRPYGFSRSFSFDPAARTWGNFSLNQMFQVGGLWTHSGGCDPV